MTLYLRILALDWSDDISGGWVVGWLGGGVNERVRWEVSERVSQDKGTEEQEEG